jgi:hypothetical protein
MSLSFFNMFLNTSWWLFLIDGWQAVCTYLSLASNRWSFRFSCVSIVHHILTQITLQPCPLQAYSFARQFVHHHLSVATQYHQASVTLLQPNQTAPLTSLCNHPVLLGVRQIVHPDLWLAAGHLGSLFAVL